jgi:hypothetical protein
MKTEYTLHEEMLKVVTTEQLLLGEEKLIRLEDAINSHPFLKAQLENENINIFISNITFMPYVTYADIDKIDTGKLYYPQWKAKTYNAMKKIGLVRDVDTYCSYILR